MPGFALARRTAAELDEVDRGLGSLAARIETAGPSH